MEQVERASRNEGADCAKSAGREKRWAEMGLEEKVERLRVALRIVNEKASQGSRTAVEAYGIAHRHEHGGTGQVVMPVEGGANRALSLMGGEQRLDRGDYVENLLA